MEITENFELNEEDVFNIIYGKKTINEVIEEKKSSLKKENVEETKTNTFDEHLTYLLKSIKRFLKEKNRKYGNAALEPINVFCNNSSEGSICTRIDDKISRIKNSNELRKNDIVDLTGYLILLLIEKGWLDFYDLED